MELCFCRIEAVRAYFASKPSVAMNSTWIKIGRGFVLRLARPGNTSPRGDDLRLRRCCRACTHPAEHSSSCRQHRNWSVCFVACWPSDAGHTDESIRKHGFGARLLNVLQRGTGEGRRVTHRTNESDGFRYGPGVFGPTPEYRSLECDSGLSLRDRIAGEAGIGAL